MQRPKIDAYLTPDVEWKVQQAFHLQTTRLGARVLPFVGFIIKLLSVIKSLLHCLDAFIIVLFGMASCSERLRFKLNAEEYLVVVSGLTFIDIFI